MKRLMNIDTITHISSFWEINYSIPDRLSAIKRILNLITRIYFASTISAEVFYIKNYRCIVLNKYWWFILIHHIKPNVYSNGNKEQSRNSVFHFLSFKSKNIPQAEAGNTISAASILDETPIIKNPIRQKCIKTNNAIERINYFLGFLTLAKSINIFSIKFFKSKLASIANFFKSFKISSGMSINFRTQQIYTTYTT